MVTKLKVISVETNTLWYYGKRDIFAMTGNFAPSITLKPSSCMSPAHADMVVSLREPLLGVGSLQQLV